MGKCNNIKGLEEIWKDIKGYEELYQVSSLGRVRNSKGLIRKPRLRKDGYFQLNLFKDYIRSTRTIHQLVAIAFLNHSLESGLVVNHINHIKTDNRIENLEIVTQRENSNRKHLASRSQYVGVDFHKGRWRAKIIVKRKSLHLGYFDNEYDAHLAYQKKLKEL